MDSKTREILELFVEKAELLRSRSFVRYVEQNGVGFSMRCAVDEPVQMNINQPDAEATEAFVTTFRMFIQDNDAISINNLSKLIDADPTLSENWRQQYLDVKQKVNEQLDRPSMCAMTIEKKGTSVRSTRRDIMETFIYGQIAHTSKEKRARYLQWKENSFFFPLLKMNLTRFLWMF